MVSVRFLSKYSWSLLVISSNKLGCINEPHQVFRHQKVNEWTSWLKYQVPSNSSVRFFYEYHKEVKDKTKVPPVQWDLGYIFLNVLVYLIKTSVCLFSGKALPFPSYVCNLTNLVRSFLTIWCNLSYYYFFPLLRLCYIIAQNHASPLSLFFSFISAIRHPFRLGLHEMNKQRVFNLTQMTITAVVVTTLLMAATGRCIDQKAFFSLSTSRPLNVLVCGARQCYWPTALSLSGCIGENIICEKERELERENRTEGENQREKDSKKEGRTIEEHLSCNVSWHGLWCKGEVNQGSRY